MLLYAELSCGSCSEILCDFSMKFCSLGFSNQKTTAFRDCPHTLSERRGSGKDLAFMQHLLCVGIPCAGHLSYVIFISFIICIFFDPDIEGFVRKGSGGVKKKERAREAENPQLVRSLSCASCCCFVSSGLAWTPLCNEINDCLSWGLSIDTQFRVKGEFDHIAPFQCFPAAAE